MDWKLKVAVQRACAALPVGSAAAYYFVQRRFGNLRNPEPPTGLFGIACEIFSDLAQIGFELDGKRVLEVGTGHRAVMPMALYLCGVQSLITVDKQRILKAELVLEDVKFATENEDQMIATFRQFSLEAAIRRRVQALRQVSTLEDALRLMNITYLAPADATSTGLPAGSIDLHFSHTVFEHIPGNILVEILKESNRLLSPDGIACHQIDLSDHCANGDASLSKVNFLRFSDREWDFYNERRFSYQNRLRKSDYTEIYEAAQQHMVAERPMIDEGGLKVLRNGFPLAEKYKSVDLVELATLVYRTYSKAKVPGANTLQTQVLH